MLLIGRTLSPFVRRTATLLHLLEIEHEDKPVAATTHPEEVRAVNPLARIPVLVLDDGETIVDSHAIVDYALEIGDPEGRVLPKQGAARRQVLYTSAIATGVMEKGVASAYERTQREEAYIYPPYLDKLLGQVHDGLAALETQTPLDAWWGGDAPNLADINAVVAYEFIGIVAPDIAQRAAPRNLPALSALADAHSAFTQTRWEGSLP